MRAALLVVRILVALAVIVAAGYFSAGVAFADLAPGETMLRRAALGAAVAALAGLLVGVLLPRAFWLGLFASWGALVFAAFALNAQIAQPYMEGWAPWLNLAGLLALPLLSLAGSYAGHRLVLRCLRVGA